MFLHLNSMVKTKNETQVGGAGELWRGWEGKATVRLLGSNNSDNRNKSVELLPSWLIPVTGKHSKAKRLCACGGLNLRLWPVLCSLPASAAGRWQQRQSQPGQDTARPSPAPLWLIQGSAEMLPFFRLSEESPPFHQAKHLDNHQHSKRSQNRSRTLKAYQQKYPSSTHCKTNLEVRIWDGIFRPR